MTNSMTEGPFLRSIEKRPGLMMKLAYAMTRRQFGKVLTPLKVHAARLPLAFGLFYSNKSAEGSSQRPGNTLERYSPSGAKARATSSPCCWSNQKISSGSIARTT
jgi:hypothetical protein